MDADTDVDVAMNDEVSDTWMEMKRNVRALEKDSERDSERDSDRTWQGLRKGSEKDSEKESEKDSEGNGKMTQKNDSEK
jgi:hypothetical protein